MGNNSSSSSTVNGGTNTNRSSNNNNNNPSTSNNSSSSSGGGHHHNLVNAISTLRKSTGSLGLSKSELDKRCKPSGLYLSCPWDDKSIRRLIGDGKIAPRVVGIDERQHASYRECPICFLHYSQSNITGCCKAYICSECYLQIRTQKDTQCACPFCTSPKLLITIATDLNEKEKKKREEEEQEAQMRVAETMKKASDNSSSSGGENDFGKSLERHNNRLRSDSMASSVSDDDASSDHKSSASTCDLMSADERKLLEEEMKQQHLHPLTRQLEREAEDRRRDHDNSYRRRNTSTRATRFGREVSASTLHRSLITHGASRSRASHLGASGRRRERDWNQVVEAFENHFGTGEVQSLDDLVVIEAAILLSMEEEAAHRRRQQQPRNNDSDNTNTDQPSHTATTPDDEESHSASPHGSRSGFPTFQTLMRPSSSRGAAANHINSNTNNASVDEEDADNINTDSSNLVSLPLSSIRRGRRYYTRSNNGRHNDSSLHDTASLMMRGVSEEEQIAMAISLSLRESESSQHSNNNDSSDEQSPLPQAEQGTENNISSQTNDNATSTQHVANADETIDNTTSTMTATTNTSTDGQVVRQQQSQTIQMDNESNHDNIS